MPCPRKSTAGPDLTSITGSSLILPASLPRDTEVDSLCFFFTKYVTIERDPQTSRGFLEYLLPLYSSAPHDSHLSVATSALAIMLTSMWSRRGVETEESRRFFGKALTMTKAAIDDPQQNTTDETLLTVLLLEFYEICSSKFKSKVSSGTHNTGAIALVKHRGSLNFRNEISKRLLIALRNRLIEAALERRESIPRDPAIWTDTAQMPGNPAIELDKICAEFANLKALYSSFTFPTAPAVLPSSLSSSASFNASASSIEIIHSLLTPALHLDTQLALWPKSIPVFWNPVKVSSPSCVHPSIEAAGLYGYACDVYSSLHVANVWNTYRVTRLCVLKIVLVCERILTGRWASAGPPDKIHYAAETVRNLVDGVCASVPYHLGNRVGPSPIDTSEGIEYPHLPNDADNFQTPPPNAVGYAVDLSREEHIRVAAAKGGWYLLDPLETILKETVFNISQDVNTDSPLLLRDGQREWIIGQLQRTRSMYLVQGATSSPPQESPT